jgi:threonine dehydratase
LADVSPVTKVYCVEPAGWDDHARSLKTGQRERNDMQGSPLCDALLSPMPGELTFSYNRRLLAGGLVVTDDEVRAAMAFAARHLKLIVEPGGAVALAAILAGKFDATSRTVGIVLSGGNV